MSTGKVVLGTLAGLAIGTITGILFAPDKGSKTRKQIMDKGDDYVVDLKSNINKLIDSLSQKFENGKTDAEKMAEKGKAKYEDAKREVKNTAADVKNAAT